MSVKHFPTALQVGHAASLALVRPNAMEGQLFCQKHLNSENRGDDDGHYLS